MVSFKKKSESLIKYYIKVTCAFKWARKLPRQTVTYESAKCVPLEHPTTTRKCTHNGFVRDLPKWVLKCKFYATGPRFLLAGRSRYSGLLLCQPRSPRSCRVSEWVTQIMYVSEGENVLWLQNWKRRRFGLVSRTVDFSKLKFWTSPKPFPSCLKPLF